MVCVPVKPRCHSVRKYYHHALLKPETDRYICIVVHPNCHGCLAVQYLSDLIVQRTSSFNKPSKNQPYFTCFLLKYTPDIFRLGCLLFHSSKYFPRFLTRSKLALPPENLPYNASGMPFSYRPANHSSAGVKLLECWSIA